jgi:hypothetical protein
MAHVLAQICPWVFVVMYVSGGIVIYLRARAKQVAYLRQFPPVDGIPLHVYRGALPWSTLARARDVAMRDPQVEDDLELQRQAVWRGAFYFALWIFGFPLLFFSALAALILAGYVRF